ncbi:MAG: beta-glucosidase BglX [Muribaculum sp.]|nr:beta-glucosidase BglX [Muribaculum sp.]
MHGADNQDMDEYIDDLLSKMTLEEKLGQMNLPPSDDIVTGAPMTSNIGQAVAEGRAGGTFNVKGAEKVLALQKIAVEKSRLGIPLIIGMDVIHGYETIFPIPLAMAATWDMQAVERSARVAATEASAAGINWTFSPMVDISRDPRWGRMAEGAGEDPYLGSEVARAMVRGYQGDLKADTQIMACIKHFALYGASEAGRDYNTVDMSRLRMFNEYLAPYKAAVDEGAGSIMTSFNLVDGIPATANKWLVTDVLRDTWGFNGFVVTDYNSIGEITVHGLGERVHASAMALNAGTDMDMAAGAFIGSLKDAIKRGEVTEEQIDVAVRRILEAKYRLGLFENPYKYNDISREKTDIYTRANRDEARSAAVKSFVLLKNEGNLLPLERKGRIALIGPLGNTSDNLTGTWCVAADHSKYKTLLDGLRDAVGDRAEILYAKGSNIYADATTERGVAFGRDIRDGRSEDELLAEALATVSQADVVIAAVGEMSESSGESASRTDLELPDTQRRLLDALLSTGKPVVMLNFSGRPTVMSWEAERVPAILNVWFGGSESADAIADVVFGDANPSGKLPVSMPRNVGQIPVYYNHLPTGRPAREPWAGFQQYVSNYVDAPNTPLYPFGFGLSYTDFEYSEFNISSTEMNMDGKITASVTVTNIGDREGDEIVQFYTRDLVGSISRPVQELKHFERISLRPGESKTVSFDITVDCLKFYNSDLKFVAEPGEFLVMVGPSSTKVATLSFSLK